MNWPVFFKRLGSAVIFCAIIIAGLTLNFEIHLVVALLIHFLCIKESLNLFKRMQPESPFPPILNFLTQVFGTCTALAMAMWSAVDSLLYFILLIPIILLFVGIMQKKTATYAALASIGTILYVSIPIGSLISLYMLYKSETLATNIPLALILLIWTNDTMAYITGSFIGKTPFSEISPKKTWEGTIGGLVFTVIGVALLNYLEWIPGLSMVDWIVLALSAAIIGTAGDLFESKLKRLANVKDSGNIMPGHGGALDRFDSMLVALPFVFCYTMIFIL